MSVQRINEIRRLINWVIESYDVKQNTEITKTLTNAINNAWQDVDDDEDFIDQLCDMLVEFDNDDVPIGLRRTIQLLLEYFEYD